MVPARGAGREDRAAGGSSRGAAPATEALEPRLLAAAGSVSDLVVQVIQCGHTGVRAVQ
jgi:hypothetical protein